MRIDMLQLLNMPSCKGTFSNSFVFFCKNCGSELTGQYDVTARISTIDRYKQPYIREWVSKESHNCPLCGASLDKSGGYFMGDVFDFRGSEKDFEEMYGEKPMRNTEMNTFEPRSKKLNTLDEKLACLEELRKRKEIKFSLEKSEEIASNYDIPVSLVSTSHSIHEIRSDSNKLNSYILTLLKLENSIYSIKQRLASLFYQKMQIDRFAVQCAMNVTGTLTDNMRKWNSYYLSCTSELEKIKMGKPEKISVQYPQKPAEPELRAPGLFNKKKVLDENKIITDQYNAAIKAYKAEVASCDRKKAQLQQEATERYEKQLSDAQAKVEVALNEIPKQKTLFMREIKQAAKLPSAATVVQSMLDKEISQAEELISKLYSARNELYAYNIVFDKYRNSVALSSFYEYLMSGRCSMLEGADGAYNIFESEIRANRVVAQLDTVISSLEDIKENQYMIYQEMRTTNAMLGRLNTTMDRALSSIQGIESNTTHMNEYMERIAENSDVIAHNTAVTAYYSKINAELTNALGYMVAFS